MTRRRPSTSTQQNLPESVAVALFKELPPARRQEIAEEGLHHVAASLVEAHRSDSVRALMAAFEAHPLWPYLRKLAISPLLPAEGAAHTDDGAAPRRPSRRAVAAAAPAVSPPRAARSAGDVAPPAPSSAAAHAASPPSPVPPPPPSSVPPPHDPGDLPAPDTAEMVASLAESLGETDPAAIEEIRDVVVLGGVDLASAAHHKALEIDAGDGLVRDGRRKTLGGVFFYLAKTRAGRMLLGPPFDTMAIVRRPAVKPAAPPTPPSPPMPEPERRNGGARGTAADRERELLETMFAFVSRNPGLREDEIRAKLGGDPVLVSATLGALCAQGRLRVSVRGRTYSVVGR